jgi:hypothetical protein
VKVVDSSGRVRVYMDDPQAPASVSAATTARRRLIRHGRGFGFVHITEQMRGAARPTRAAHKLND